MTDTLDIATIDTKSDDATHIATQDPNSQYGQHGPYDGVKLRAWNQVGDEGLVRDQVKDHLLTPKNSMLITVDYQPTQVNSIKSMDHQLLVDNIVRLAWIGKLYELPVVLSTLNVTTGMNAPTISELQEVLTGVEAPDRTTINAWEDAEFRAAVKATGRKKLIMAALWTEACLTFSALDAMLEGYEVYPVVDAIGGTSVEAHRAALARIEQAGAKPTSWVQVSCEQQRDWARQETANSFRTILFAPRKSGKS